METNSTNDAVNHPRHYTEGFAPVSIECIDITRHMPFTVGNAFKYVWRAGKKAVRRKPWRICGRRSGIFRTQFRTAALWNIPPRSPSSA